MRPVDGARPTFSRRRLHGVAVTTVLALTVAACASDDGASSEGSTPSAEATSTPSTPRAAPGDSDALTTYTARLDEIRGAVDDWAAATTISAAHAAAEVAANLVVGPGGPGFGDRDDDGTAGGDADEGLLSGRGGTPPGIATALAERGCVGRDVLGAAADDVDAGWGQMLRAIDEWTPSDNTMPSLASHPMRVVGWATFTLASDSLDEAHEYAGHARLHVDVSAAAPTC